MPLYVYEGSGTSLTISGRELRHGQPRNLEGRAAEAAGRHPDVRALDAPKASRSSSEAPAGLAEFAAIKARAKELGIPATGKKVDLVAAIAAEEQRLAASADSGED